MAKHTVTWKKHLTGEEFDAAFNYLSLTLPTRQAQRLVATARHLVPMQRIAKDVLRASRLPLLPRDERHVAEDLKKIRKGKSLAPIILIQGDLASGRPPIIADGYHRMCAACHADEDAAVGVVLVPMR
jgi:hypothetical protein